MKSSQHVKIVVFVPKSHAKKVRETVGEAGAGRIGNYTHCYFESEGYGYFRPEKGAKPFQGTIGKIARTREVRLEFICPKKLQEKLLKVIRKTHPYEETAIDIYPIQVKFLLRE